MAGRASGTLTTDSMKAFQEQTVSKTRVAEHGEVYTAAREVNAMLDLVPQETERIESRFLEPACGHGNFLVEILRRKLAVVAARYRTSRADYERYAILALTSVYGIDILEDNVRTCRARLLEVLREQHRLIVGEPTPDLLSAAAYIVGLNIVHGDALTLETVGDTPGPIVLSEWSPVNGTLLKRRDFSYGHLLQHEGYRQLPMWSDLDEDVFIPTPVRDFPLVHFLRVSDADK